jgi:hypothetical protein
MEKKAVGSIEAYVIKFEAPQLGDEEGAPVKDAGGDQ